MSQLRKMRRSQARALAPYQLLIDDVHLELAQVERQRRVSRWCAALAVVVLAVCAFTRVGL